MANDHTIPQRSSRSRLLYISLLLPVVLIVFTSYSTIFTMSDIKNVIVIGAGGNLGPSILNALIESQSFNVSVLSRESSSSTFPSSVKVHRVNYDSPDALKSAFQGQDAVLSIVGGTALGDQNKFIDAAIAAGVKRFLPSEYGSNTVNPRLLEIVPVFKAKKGTVDYLKSKEDVISWTSIITGPFFDWGLKVGFLGFDQSSKTANFIDEGKATFSATNLRQIGETVVKSLQSPSVSKNQYIYVSSFQVSQADLLPIVEKVTGQKFTVKNTASQDLIQTGRAKLQKGDFSGIPDLIRAGVSSSEGLGDSTPAGLWNEKLGLKKEDLEESVKTALGGKLVGEQ